MFVAGIDTASTTLGWAMAELMKNPKAMEKAHKEMRHALGRKKVEESDISHLEYMKLALKETLRLHPPVPMLVSRESMEKCTLERYEIPAKTRVFVNALAIGRHPNHYDDLENFNPERFSNSMVDYKGQDLISFLLGEAGEVAQVFYLVWLL
ncbi:hypothetical protein AMTRI_Chr10g227300 [Amborella trichopoda]